MVRHLTGRDRQGAVAIRQSRLPAPFGRTVHRSQINRSTKFRHVRSIAPVAARVSAAITPQPKPTESVDFATTFRFARQSGYAVNEYRLSFIGGASSKTLPCGDARPDACTLSLRKHINAATEKNRKIAVGARRTF